MKKLGILKNIRTTYESIIKLKKMGVNVEHLITDLNIIFEEWKLNAESLNISKDYTSPPILNDNSFYILYGMEWILVTSGKITVEGSLTWEFKYSDSDSDKGTTKAGRWAHCRANGRVFIDLSLKGLSLLPLHRI